MQLPYFILLLLTLTLGTGCQFSQTNSSKPTVLFAGLSFSLPAQPKVIAIPNAHGDFLVLKYSNQPRQDYLAFSQEPAIDASCSSAQFFQAVIQPTQNTQCNSHAVMVFTQQFADHYPAEHWPGAQFNAYYFQTNDQRRFVFTPLVGNKLLKIDSDFLSEQQLRGLLGGSD